MNRVYRLVFNRTLGVMQVASELVKAARGGLDAGGGAAMATLQPMSFALWVALGWVALVQPLAAQQAPAVQEGRIVADPNAPANQRPTIVTSANGTPQVNITTPSAAGVSRNSYRQFDVGPDGAILNNARGNVQTEIGGWVQGNPWLATGTARVILNEVNSSSPSQLRGYVEVAGDRAQVVIANPAGIQVDGGGFLNANRVTLTTGTPIFNGGSLEGYRVEGGAVRIAGAGLDTSRADYTDIISRSLDVNAGLWANRLQASLGNNIVSADQSSIARQEGEGQQPTFALDVGALGGMYANRIWLVGNEHGLGVRNAGQIGAQAGELIVTVDGRIENTGALQSQLDTRLTGGTGVLNAGTVSAAREVVVHTAGALDNSGGTLNGRRVEVNAGSLRNKAGVIEQAGSQTLALRADTLSNRDGGLIGAVASAVPGSGPGTGGTGTGSSPGSTEPAPGPGTGSGNNPAPAPTAPTNVALATGALNIIGALDNDGGRIDAVGAISLASAGLDNSGGKLGLETLRIGGGELRNVGGRIDVQGDASVLATRVDNSAGSFSVAKAFALEAGSLANRAGAITHQDTRNTRWSVTGALDNSDGSIASNAGTLQLDAALLNNQRGQIRHAGADALTLNSNGFDGQSGSIFGAGAVVLNATTADHRNARLNATRISIDADDFDNRGGSVIATGQQANTIIVDGKLDNGAGGTLASNGDLLIVADTFGNAGGTVQQAGSGTLAIGAAALHGQAGTLLSNGELVIRGETTDLRGGTTSAQRITIETGDLTTAGGQLSATGSGTLGLTARHRLDNSGGTLGSNGAVAIDAGSFINQQGRLVAAGTEASTIRASNLLVNQGGSIEHAGSGQLNITASSLQGSGGTIASNGNLDLRGDTLDLGKGGTRAKHVTLSAGSLVTSEGTLLSTGEEAMQLKVRGDIDNDRGTIGANGAQVIEAGALSNRGGTLSSAGSADTRIEVAGRLDNSDGTLASNAGALQLGAGYLVNERGTVSHAGSNGLTLQAGQLDGRQGSIGTAGAVTLRAGAVDHRDAKLHAAQVDLAAEAFDNRAGSVVATGQQANTLQVHAALDNGAGGTLASNGDLLIAAATFGNAGGVVQQAGSGLLSIHAATLNGQGGTLLSNGALTIQGDSTDLRGGTTSAQRISIDTGDLTTAGGQLSATGTDSLSLQVRNRLDNTGGSLGSNGAIDLRAGSFINQQGKLVAAGTAASSIIASQLLDNQGGSLTSNGQTHIHAAQVLNAGGSIVGAGTDALRITTADLQGAGGTIASNGELDLQGETLDLQKGSTRAKRVKVTAGNLVTAQGTLVSTGDEAMQLQVRGEFDNDGGTVAANGAQIIEAGVLSNRGGTLSSAGTDDTRITVAGRLDNSEGTLASNAAALQIHSGSLVNERGTLSHAGNNGLTVQTGRFDGQHGTVATAGTLTLSAAELDHRNATINASRILLDAVALDNRGGTIVATSQQANVFIVQGSFDNGLGGMLASNGDLSITANSFGNAGGTVQQAGTGTLALHAGTIDGQGGTLVSNGVLTLNAEAADLRNGKTSAARISIQAGDLTTAGGQLSATGTDALSLQVRNRLDNTGGTIAGNGTLNLSATAFLNNQGTVQAAGAGSNELDIGAALDNRGGRILTTGAASVTAGSLDNRGGTLHTAGVSQLVLNVDGLLDNQAQGIISSGGDAQVTARNLDNGGGTLASEQALVLTTTERLDNRNGLIQAGRDLHLSSAGLDNAAGRVIGTSVDVDTRGASLDNRSGTLASLAGALVVRSGALDNSAGLLQSASALRVDTAGQTLTNASSNGSGIVSAGTLELNTGHLDNHGGVVFAQDDIRLTASGIDNTQGGSVVSAADIALRAQTLGNAGGTLKSGGNAELVLQGQLDNNAGLIAAGGLLTLQAASVDNRNTLTGASGPALGLQAGNLQLTTATLDNRLGQVLADAATLQLGGQLNNSAGQVSTAGSLDIRADVITNTAGTLSSGGNQGVHARQLSGDGKLLSQGNVTLELGEGFTNVGEVAANGALTLSIQGTLDNQGKLQGGAVSVQAGRIVNAATGEISSIGLTRVNADGELVNRGLIDGGISHVSAGMLDNVGTGRIYGDHVAVQAGTLLNRAETLAGTTKAATIAARERLDLGVGTLSNTGQSLIYSDGDAAIGGALADRTATGTAQKIDNLGSTIEISGNLDIAALAVNNIRENVVIERATTVNAPVRLDQPDWFKNGGNDTNNIRTTANYSASEIYYLSPDDILEDTPYVTPDGYMIRKAVVRLTANTSAYFFGRGGLHSAKGERARLAAQDGTVTIYYTARQDNQANPDQVAAGADNPFQEVSYMGPGTPAFSYVDDKLNYSSAYGTCTTNCVQLITQYQYDDPDHILTNMQRHTSSTGGNEKYRIATHTVVEDVLRSAGAEATIHAGGNMRITTDALTNQYARIAAGGNLAIVGLNRDTSQVTNIAQTLYRTHSFDNTSYTYNGASSRWSNPEISEKTGEIGGVITANGTLTVDVGDLSNLNNGRDAPNVQDGATVANLNTQGPGAGAVGPGAGPVQGAGQAHGQIAVGAAADGPAGASGPAQGPGTAPLQDVTGGNASQAAATGPAGAQNGGTGGVGGTGVPGQTQVVRAAGDDPRMVVTAAVNGNVPSASLYKVDAAHGSHLVETDPRFASYRDWLSSDYLLSRAGYEPAATQKRLGDGFYEQKLVREQIGQLTGRRFLDGYASDEDQYQALLEAGATVAKSWGLRPGVALTAEQMAQLTSDIVWLVEQTITLPDGSVTQALVPQVYLRVLPGDLDVNGALLAGANVEMKLRGDLVNTGDIAGRQLVSIDAQNIRNLAGAQISGGQVGLQARQDIEIIGSTVTATDAMSLKAGGDITVASTTREWRDDGGLLAQQTIKLDRVAGLYVTHQDGAGVLSINAGGNVELRAAQLANAGTDGLTAIVAGGDLNLTSLAEQSSVSLTHDSRNFNRQSQSTNIGTTISGAGDVVLKAGNDLNLSAANVSAANALVAQAGRDINSVAVVDTRTFDSGAKSRNGSREVSAADGWVLGNQLTGGEGVALQAGRDLTLQATTVDSRDGGVVLSAGRDLALTTAQETHDLVVDEQSRKKKTLSSTTTTSHDESSASYAVGSVVGGKSVDMIAGNDVTITGSTVLADNDLRIAAANNITIESAQDTYSEASSFSQKKSGITGGFGNGVASVGYSSSRSHNDSASQSTTQVASAVGSMDGNVLINAGNQLTIATSDVAAGQDLTLVGKDINLIARQDTQDTQNSQSSKSSGFSMGVTYDPTKAYRSARDSTTDGMADSGSIMGDITRNAEGTASGLRAATTSTVIAGGSQRSSGNQTHSTSDARVSQLSAGGDLTLIANGGSITSQGAQMSAEGDALLLATKNIVFDVAHNTESSTNQSSGKGWGFANNTSGLPFGTNNSHGEGSGSSDTITGTQLSVGGGVRMATSEGDISLTAANIVAEKDVNIHAAGDLTIRSGQDTVSNTNTSQSKAIGTVQISDTEKFSGWHRQEHDDDSAQVSQVASNVGSLGGNVNLSAGGTYSQIASNVVSAKDINITAAQIELLTADEVGHSSQRDDDLKIGVFARVKSPLIDLINNVDAARQSDGRLQSMQNMAAAANAYQAASAMVGASGAGGSGLLFSAEAGIGFKTANSSADSSSVVSQGSTLQAGGNLNLTSTSGDIHVVQGNLSAGNTVSLDSARHILLEAGQAHLQDKSKSSNAGAEVGVGVQVGAQTGAYVYAEASVGSSKSNANSTSWQNTTLTGQNISLKAEGDTTLRGATATADRIDVKTGGTLTIESLQDMAESMSKNSQVGGRVQVSLGTAWSADGYASAGKSNGSYQGVGQQSGLFAGDGGYHVEAGHVNLVGGAIASTSASNSELTAQTLTFSDLQNQMQHSTTSGSISGGYGGAMDGNTPVFAGATPNFGGGVPMHESGGDSSTTYATLTEGNIVIGGKKVTAAELGVNTDAATAHRAIDAMPNAELQLANQQAMAAAMGTVASTSKQIADDIGNQAMRDLENSYLSTMTDEEKLRFKSQSAEDSAKELAAKFPYSYSDAVAQQQNWGIGSQNGRALEAVTTLLVGVLSGQGGGQVAANALAPYAAQLIGNKFDANHGSDPNAGLQLLSHALLGALLAEVNGGNAVGGAVAATGGELAAKLLTEALYPGYTGELDDHQKQTILALSQAVGAVAGGLGGQGLSAAGLGANVAENSVKNNFLTKRDVEALSAKLKQCDASDEACRGAVVREAEERSAANNKRLLACHTLECANAIIPEIFNGAREFGSIYDADAQQDNKKKLAFGAIADVETYALLVAANMAAGLPKYLDGSIDKDSLVAGVNALNYTQGVPGTFFQGAFNGYERFLGSTKQPHEYETTSVACAVSYTSSCGNVVDQFNALRRYAGPGTDGKALVGNGVVSYLSIMHMSLGYVTHLIDPSTSSLINITVPGAHALDPGFVIRQVVPDGHGGFSVSTRGWGTGSSPAFNSNSWADNFVWAPNTRNIGSEVSKLQWPWSDFPSRKKCMSTRDSQGKLVEVCQ